MFCMPSIVDMNDYIFVCFIHFQNLLSVFIYLFRVTFFLALLPEGQAADFSFTFIFSTTFKRKGTAFCIVLLHNNGPLRNSHCDVGS